MISPTCFSMVCRGLSEVIGSWKMIEILLAADVAHGIGTGAFSRSLPPKTISPEGCDADG